MKHIRIVFILSVILSVASCAMDGGGGSGGSSIANPLSDIPPIEFATFNAGTSGSIYSSGLLKSPENRFEYVNSINDKLLVLIPNWIKNDLEAHLNNGGDLDQPVFLETEFPGSAMSEGMPGKSVTRATVQRVESNEGLVFRGILAARLVLPDGTYSDGGSIDNAPVEIFFSKDLRAARLAIGNKPEGEVAYRRDALEFTFPTNSGVMIGDWGEIDDEAPHDFQVNISYEGISFDGEDVTY